MKAREFKPRRLDVRAFAEDGETLSGDEPAAGMPRLLELRHPDAAGDPAPVAWSATGSLHPRRGAEPEVRLHLRGTTTLALTCQRCLEPVEATVTFDRDFLFVTTESEAAALDADSEEDVLVLGRAFDLLELVEDELLLEVPLVPMHEACPVEVALQHEADDAPQAPGEDEARDGEAPHPFAALAALRRTPGDGSTGG